MGDEASARADFGRYELIRELAAGGMGRIFLARQSGIEGFSRLCVLKRIRGELADSELSTLLIDEARIAASLHHPNIASVFDFGRHDGELFLAMEYVAGPNLDDLVNRAIERGEPVSTAVVIRVLADVARGLAYAHSARDASGKHLGVVHRDISPHNVLVSIHGEVKITDFGIAKAVGRLHRSVTGEVRGKIQYMSPEQLAGEAVDARADIFSVGVMLWELLTGRPLFRGRSIDEVIHERVSVPIADPRTINPAIPADLAETTMAALASHDARIPSASALADALRNSPAAESLTSDDIGALVRRLFPDVDEHGKGPAGAIAVAPTELASGMRVGDFEIVGLLGEGAAGVVYDAVNPMIGKKAAIKVLRTQLATDTEFVARFLREARAVNEINHAFIIDIFAFGALEDGRPYCAMDRLEGETLAQALRRGPMAPEAALEILGQVAEALDAAHQRGIFHRDLKPDNVYLTSAGVRVLDFGLAKHSGEAVSSTQSGLAIGTPMYMSPEQAAGGDIDQRSDIYSFGVLAFRMLTGADPFGAERPLDALAARFTAEPGALSAHGLAAELDAPMARCLARDRDARFTSIAEAHQALAAAHARSGRRRRSRASLLVVAGLAVILAIGATGAAVFFGGSADAGERSSDGGVASTAATGAGEPTGTDAEATAADVASRVDAGPAATTPDAKGDDGVAPGDDDVIAAAREQREHRAALRAALRRRIEQELARACTDRGMPAMPPEVKVLVRMKGVGVARITVLAPDAVKLCGVTELSEPLIERRDLGYKPTFRLAFAGGSRAGAAPAATEELELKPTARGLQYLENVINNECALRGDGPFGFMTVRFATDAEARPQRPRLSKKAPASFSQCVARMVAQRIRLKPDRRYRLQLSIAKGLEQMKRERDAAEAP